MTNVGPNMIATATTSTVKNLRQVQQPPLRFGLSCCVGWSSALPFACQQSKAHRAQAIEDKRSRTAFGYNSDLRHSKGAAFGGPTHVPKSADSASATHCNHESRTLAV